MSYITTYTRKHFDPVHPDQENICIQDIAHALSMLCRGNTVSAAQRRHWEEDIPGGWLLPAFFTMPVNAICQMSQDR